MVHRTIQDKLVQISQPLPVITITGPGELGKTTLAKYLFPNHTYVNLELSDNRDLATTDPRSFLRSILLILDEVQRAPNLLSYIQEIVDECKQNGQFTLIGSENLLLSDKVNQSLAGRTYMATLLPLSLGELQSVPISFANCKPYF